MSTSGVPLSTMILGGSLYTGARAEIQKRRDAKAAKEVEHADLPLEGATEAGHVGEVACGPKYLLF